MADTTAPKPPKERLESLDAFRGLTILLMIFVIAVAAGRYQNELDNPLPQTMRWFGSLPISTWFHAEVGFDLWEQQEKARLLKEVEADGSVAPEAREAVVVARLKAAPEQNLRGIGVTITDLVAPWFVFIVGACIPLSKGRHGVDWWKHVGWRTAMLILAGVAYISLVIQQISWWWGVLQAIGVAYFVAAALCRVPASGRLPVILAVGGANALLTAFVPAWTMAFEGISAPFGTLTNPGGDWLKPWIVHCQPWLSISYGVMAMIGVLVGDALATKEQRTIITRCLWVGALFTALGYGMHFAGFATGQYHLCMNKPDVTTSYAFFTAGLGCLGFLAFYYVMDVLKIRAWAMPLQVFGANPLLAYFLMIVQRRVFASLGIIDAFNRVTPDNKLVANWAAWLGPAEEPSATVLWFFQKGGYHGVFWGLVWTACLWLVVRFCNRRGLYWKL